MREKRWVGSELTLEQTVDAARCQQLAQTQRIFQTAQALQVRMHCTHSPTIQFEGSIIPNVHRNTVTIHNPVMPLQHISKNAAIVKTSLIPLNISVLQKERSAKYISHIQVKGKVLGATPNGYNHRRYNYLLYSVGR
ncbi:Hypothetical predicted protein [Pelobates cultripes]|uniref:Uncharacterized protein n=1 Tax=Pelobates cultripes TaxID=61616 RepID=A0AAD1RYR5_PELCU|nr:Hypothetical predicted protein [Pelobates cultripes]